MLRSFPLFSCLWQPSIVVSQQALNTFLSRPLDKRTNGPIDQIDQTECLSNSQTGLNCVKSNGSETSVVKPASLTEGDISVEDILCSHGRLDPGKAADMKRIDRVRPELQSIFSYLTIRIIQATYESFIVPSGASFVPALAPTDICRTCVEDTFLGGFITSRFWNRRDITLFHLEKLYQYQHPRHVAQFDAVVNEVDSIGHWVSRRWLKGAYRLFFYIHTNRIVMSNPMQIGDNRNRRCTRHLKMTPLQTRKVSEIMSCVNMAVWRSTFPPEHAFRWRCANQHYAQAMLS